MSQRRRPSGQGPAGRGSRPGRVGRGAGRDGGTRADGPRLPGRGGQTRADAARAAARPAAARRGTSTAAGAAKRTRAPQPRRLTGRATVLAMVLLGLLLAYAYPVRVYLSQQAEISALEQRQQEQLRRIDSLAEKRAKWNDDEYVKSQARRRLHYVLPGEVPLVVLDSGAANPATGSGRASTPADDGRPWYGKLWSSIHAADRPGSR